MYFEHDHLTDDINDLLTELAELSTGGEPSDALLDALHDGWIYEYID